MVLATSFTLYVYKQIAKKEVTSLSDSPLSDSEIVSWWISDYGVIIFDGQVDWLFTDEITLALSINIYQKRVLKQDTNLFF